MSEDMEAGARSVDPMLAEAASGSTDGFGPGFWV